MPLKFATEKGPNDGDVLAWDATLLEFIPASPGSVVVLPVLAALGVNVEAGGVVEGTDATVAATAGGPLRIIGGDGNTTGAGGAAGVTGGAGGNDAVGGAVTITGGAAGGGNRAGGAVTVAGGAAAGSSTGGAALLKAGGGGASGIGGATSIQGGGGFGASRGGHVNISGGTADASGAGGSVNLIAGATASGTNGQVNIQDSNANTLVQVGPTNNTLGLFGATPVAQAAAYTQTYSTATRTVGAATAAAVATTGAALTSYGYTQAQADSIPVAINALIADVLVLRKLINALIDDSQAIGIAA